MSFFYHLGEISIPNQIRAANLWAPLTQANTSAEDDGGSAAWNFHSEAGNTYTADWLPRGGLRITRTGSGGGYSGVMLWNQQRMLSALVNGALLSLYVVMRRVDGTPGDLVRVTSEARQAGYVSLGIRLETVLYEDFRLYRYDFTLQNYTAGQLNIVGFAAGIINSPIEIRDVALVLR